MLGIVLEDEPLIPKYLDTVADFYVSLHRNVFSKLPLPLFNCEPDFVLVMILQKTKL